MSKKEKEIKETAAAEDSGVSSDKPKKKGNFKKLKFGSMSIVVIALVVAIVVVVNLMCSAVTKRYPLKLDLTPDKRYELSDDSKAILENLDKDVEITVTSTKDTFTSMASYFKQLYASYYGVNVDMPYDIIPEILDKYSVYAESGKGSINVRYVDINKDPDVISGFNKIYNGEIAEGSIVVRAGDRIKVISNDDVISMITPAQSSSQTNHSMTFVGESTITSAIMAVKDANPGRAVMISSMNGSSIYETAFSSPVSSFESFLSKNGYDCTEVDAGTDALSPDDYDLVVLAVPAIDFTEDIVQKFSDFLYNGGKLQKNMIYIPNLYAGDLPNIEELLAEWRIQIDDAYIFDEEKMVQTYIQAMSISDYSPMLSIADAEIVGTPANEALPIAGPGTRAITIISKNNEVITKELLKSADSSYLRALGETDEVSDEKQSYNAAVLARKEAQDGLDVIRSNMLVIGSSFMMDSYILQNTNTYNNATVLLNMINSVTGKEASIVIPDKALQQATIAPTTKDANVIRIIVIVIIPVLVAITGVIVLLRRKNK